MTNKIFKSTLWMNNIKFYFGVLGVTVIVFIFWHLQKLQINVGFLPVVHLQYHVPNIVHYVVFGNCTINFFMYLSILSVIKIQKPTSVFIHTNAKSCSGYYWDILISKNVSKNIKLQYFPQPTHVYGQPLSSVYHASDVARIRILQLFGGVYLDNDVLLVDNLNPLRFYKMTLGWPEGQYIGNQVIIAEENATFLQLWLSGYKHYRPRSWYYNAGQYPTEILLKNYSNLVHREATRLGVHYLLDKLVSNEMWHDWRSYYAIHALSRHNSSLESLNFTTVQNSNTNLAKIIRYIVNL